MKHVTRPTQGLASHAAFPAMTPQRQETLITIALDLRQQHGDRYAKQWLAQQLQSHPEPEENITHKTAPADAFDNAFDTTRPWSAAQVEAIADELESGPLGLYRELHRYASADAHRLGYKLTAFQHEFFCIAEVLAYSTGLPRSSFYRHLKKLIQAGLVDARGHRTSVSRFGTRCDGTIFAIKLNPRRSGQARCTFVYLKSQAYRDLEADIHEKRTFWAVRQSRNEGLATLQSLVGVQRWLNSKCTGLQGSHSQPRYLTVSCQTKSGLDAVFAVTQSGPQRGRRIASAVKATVVALGDHHSIPFWWRFFDALARYYEAGGKDYAPHIHLALERERTAKAEGFARNAAALFISRLKATGVYMTLMA